jgi:hypothetical protein
MNDWIFGAIKSILSSSNNVWGIAWLLWVS